MRAAVLTVSDGVHEGTRDDRSGDTLAELLTEEGFEVTRRIVPDEQAGSPQRSPIWRPPARVVLTTGGTGSLHATSHPRRPAPLLEREAPGVAEAIRADARTRTPHALFSRGVAGLVGETLVVNLPGSPGGCRDGFEVLRPALRHGLELAAGDRETEHRQT